MVHPEQTAQVVALNTFSICHHTFKVGVIIFEENRLRPVIQHISQQALWLYKEGFTIEVNKNYK